MTKPVRIQLRRAKGWRMPENTVRVSRPSKYGNPWRVDGYGGLHQALKNGFDWSGVHGADALWHAFFLRHCPEYHQSASDFSAGTRALATEAAVTIYRLLCEHFQRSDTEQFEAWISPLRGKNLACWCPIDQPCHADVLLELANGVHEVPFQ